MMTTYMPTPANITAALLIALLFLFRKSRERYADYHFWRRQLRMGRSGAAPDNQLREMLARK
jgi:hypothetical protein